MTGSSHDHDHVDDHTDLSSEPAPEAGASSGTPFGVPAQERLRYRPSTDHPELRAAAAYVPIARRNLDADIPAITSAPPTPVGGKRSTPWVPGSSRRARRRKRTGFALRAFTTSVLFLTPPLLVVLVARIAESLYGT